MNFRSLLTVTFTFFSSWAAAETIAQINGRRFLSPLDGQNVTDVRGLVTEKGADGFWMRSTTPDRRRQTSESIYVFGNETVDDVSVGDVVTLSGQVDEYRSSPDYLYLTEIVDAANITVVSTDNRVFPRVLGRGGLSPPTEQFTSLDNGDVFGIPNNQSQISSVNPLLQPAKFGLDFWESLSGELVTIQSVVAISKPNQFGDTWIRGDWRVTGLNGRGGLTVTDTDANPEALIVLSPLDGTENPQTTKLGDSLEDITGVLTYAFGNYGIYPRTALQVLSSQQPPLPPPADIISSRTCNGVTMGQYNVENLDPGDDTFDDIAGQIVTYLRSPDLLFLQEIQDNDGPTNDGVVSSNITLSRLVEALAAAGSDVEYDYITVNPLNNVSGGEPGGNIRNAYLYNTALLRLRNPNPGSSTDSVEVLPGPRLSFNPSRIDPSNPAWEDSRVPLVAEWETLNGRNRFFTVNVHWTSKGGGTSLEGDARPPVNGGVEQRELQAEVTGSFIRDILREDRQAAVISAGDYNEFDFVGPLETFKQRSGLRSLDQVTGIPPTERYTYIFGQSCQQLDHMYVSPRLAGANPQFEHVHVSSWVTFADQVSDHDPSVARLNVCAV